MPILFALLLLAFIPLTNARTIGIFNGAGTCEGCGETVGAFFEARNDKVIYLNEKTLNAATLSKIEVYVQPGGSDDIDETLNALVPAQIKALRQFVNRGGSYLGICAGAYLAARISVMGSGKPAYALIDAGEVESEITSSEPTLLPVLWQGKKLWLYSQSGPHLGTTAPPGATVLGRFQRSGHIAGLITNYGQGKVMLIGPHLEAGSDWYQADGLSLQYGTAEAEFALLLDKL